MSNRPYGSHLSGGKDLSKGIKQAEDSNFQAWQVFLSSPRSASLPSPHPSDADWGQLITDRNWKVYCHAPYMLNPASEKDSLRPRVTEVLEHTVDRALTLQFQGIVLHAGSGGSAKEELAQQRMVDTLQPVLDRMEGTNLKLLIEPSAGHRGSLSARMESLVAYGQSLSWHPALSFCLDTAHLLEAGEALDQEGGTTRLMEQFSKLIGFDRLAVIHVNDSTTARGSRRDHHANWGEGQVGPYCLSELDRALPNHIPFVLETPGTKFKSDVELLKTICC